MQNRSRPFLQQEEQLQEAAESATYSVGQMAWNMFSGSNGTILEGMQQPYEISVVTSIENTDYINLVCTVYPNPTRGSIKLIVKSADLTNMGFQLYDINGTILQDKPIRDEETDIYMSNLFSSVYFLRISRDNREVKVFKIIKL
ncbi:MAG: T9SS type A sorting domain-containing protein [Marinilabiliales bacterium]|nr:T9SS type A sorting domain-containing protein [Marinilabiliales bacterium]